MTYLNDVEDGGNTYFTHYNLRIKPEIGKTLIWPAEWTHAHCGEILNSGVKESQLDMIKNFECRYVQYV